MNHRAPRAYLALARGEDLDSRLSPRRRLAVVVLAALFLLSFPLWAAQASSPPLATVTSNSGPGGGDDDDDDNSGPGNGDDDTDTKATTTSGADATTPPPPREPEPAPETGTGTSKDGATTGTGTDSAGGTKTRATGAETKGKTDGTGNHTGMSTKGETDGATTPVRPSAAKPESGPTRGRPAARCGRPFRSSVESEAKPEDVEHVRQRLLRVDLRVSSRGRPR